MKRTIDLINELKNKCNNFDKECMNKHKISNSEYNFFLKITKDSKFNSKEIADKMNLSLSRVSRIIDKLVRNDFLFREHNKQDRRTINIKLSPKGEKIQKEIENYRNDCEKRIIENIPPSILENIKDSFENIIKVL